jgi:hypothetical protein
MKYFPSDLSISAKQMEQEIQLLYQKITPSKLIFVMSIYNMNEIARHFWKRWNELPEYEKQKFPQKISFLFLALP